MSQDQSYLQALSLLNSSRRQARPNKPDVNPPHPDPSFSHMPQTTPDLRGTPSLVGMSEWLAHLGHTQSSLAKLNIVHVAGTKGKGSTCAFTRSLLEAHGRRTGWPRPSKVGMYTSPDLIHIRERIQIAGRPLSEEMFAKYFFEVWNVVSKTERRPRFLQLLCLMSFQAFLREGMDVAIIETHHGGEFDATNIIERPCVTAVTSIGMDHLKQLGPTIENIAWHKAGIFKTGAAAVTIAQRSDVVAVLKERAEERGALLKVVDVRNDLPDEIALRAPVQKLNCSLAITIVDELLQRLRGERLAAEDIVHGVQQFSWPGRFQHISQGCDQWYLDGAHNELSIKQAVEWFGKCLQDRSRANSSAARIVIFSHISNGRDGVELLLCLKRAVQDSGVSPSHVIFTTYQERRDGRMRPDKTLQDPAAGASQLPRTYPEIWKGGSESKTENVSFEPCIEDALEEARIVGAEHGGMHVLITGSLHLVGGALHLLQDDPVQHRDCHIIHNPSCHKE